MPTAQATAEFQPHRELALLIRPPQVKNRLERLRLKSRCEDRHELESA